MKKIDKNVFLAKKYNKIFKKNKIREAKLFRDFYTKKIELEGFLK